MPCVNEYYCHRQLEVEGLRQIHRIRGKGPGGELPGPEPVSHPDARLCRQHQGERHDLRRSSTRFRIRSRAEIGTPSRPAKATDEEWEKIQKESQELAKDSHDYAVWAFFQVLPRVTDPAKQIQVLDTFLKTYPEVEKDNAAQVNTIYFQAYQSAGQSGQDCGVRR